MNYVCPVHNRPLDRQRTQYGNRWQCGFAGCTVALWNGHTSTPADAETRKLRHECHLAFDPLWQHRKPFRDRKEAYRWLQRVMNLSKDQAHIDMFTKAQCEELLRHLAQMTEHAK